MPTRSNIHDIGVSLLQPHYAYFLENSVSGVSWLEILSDNYLFSHGLLRQKMLKLREKYPMVLHGVGLNLGSVDPLDGDYLKALKRLANDLSVTWVSDHLCWTAVDGIYSHELLPLPFTQEALDIIVPKIQEVQTQLQRPLLIENVSTYWQPEHDLSEPEFINEIVRQTGCGILLDINNIYVCAHNHHFSADQYLQAINPSAVKQFHLAGYLTHENLLIDTHSTPVSGAVWDLYHNALKIFGKIPTNLEWDNDIPIWDVMESQLQKIRDMNDRVA